MFDGWSPTEIHEHYDKDGNYTGRTVVTREPLWDDTDRARALELEEVEAGRCSCGCGQPLTEAYDKDRAWDVIGVTCYARRAIERTKRDEQQAAKDGNAREGWDDGRYYVIQDSFIYEPPGEDGVVA